MIIRALDSDGDWTYGNGKNSYKKDQDAAAQLVETRVKSFVNDCFFASDAGIDWFNLLGQKNQLALYLAISSTILNTESVTKLLTLSVNTDSLRLFSVAYKALTSFESQVNPIDANIGYLLTESGNVLATENGDEVVLG